MKGKNEKTTTGQAADAAIRTAMFRNGGEFPADVEDTTSPASLPSRKQKDAKPMNRGYTVPTRVHQDAADTVSKMMRSKNVDPEPNAPVRLDGNDVVDASGLSRIFPGARFTGLVEIALAAFTFSSLPLSASSRSRICKNPREICFQINEIRPPAPRGCG